MPTKFSNRQPNIFYRKHNQIYTAKNYTALKHPIKNAKQQNNKLKEENAVNNHFQNVFVQFERQIHSIWVEECKLN